MSTIGIVAEYNPFHTGHRYQIEESRRMTQSDAPVVAVMSGNWVQQADCAISDKWLRARLALMGGVDLVLELPTVWAMSTAESFARGAVSILNATGVVDTLSFGSECGSIDDLKRVAACLDSDEYRAHLHQILEQGNQTFAVSRQKAAEACLGEVGALLSKPNNNLGIEYIRTLNALDSSITPITVLRKGAAHNSVVAVLSPSGDSSLISGPAFISATQIRCSLLDGLWDQVEPYLVPGGRSLLENQLIGLPELEHVSRAMLAKIRTMSAQDWAKLPDSGTAEGLPQRLEQAGRSCCSVADFFSRAKTKRYSHARLGRLLLCAYLGLTTDAIPSAPPYLRVLGFSTRGQALLKQMKRCSSLPIITKPAHANDLDPIGSSLFELEARCTDLYDLCFHNIPAPGREWTTDPVRFTDEV